MNEKTELPACTGCHGVILRVYGELRAQGADEVTALRAAYRVLALRHPERNSGDIAATVAGWIAGGAG